MSLSLTVFPLTLAASIAVHAPSADREDVFPSAVVTSRGLVVAWVARSASRAEVVFARASDLETFAPPESVSGALDGDAIVRPHAAARGERIVITWADAASGDLDVRAVTSEDGGRTFSAPTLVAGGPGSQRDPRAVVGADGGLAITFQDDFGATAASDALLGRVRVARAAPGDRTFGIARAVGDVDPRQAIDLAPAIAGVGTATAPFALVHMRARHAGSSGLRLAIGEASGAFDDGIPLDVPFDRPRAPRIAASSAGQVVVFDGRSPAAEQRIEGLATPDADFSEIGVLIASDGEGASEAHILNTTRALSQTAPDVAAEGADVVVAWLDHSAPGRRRVVGRRSANGGRTFGDEVVLVEGRAELRRPAVAVRAGLAFVTFERETGGSFDVEVQRWP